MYWIYPYSAFIYEKWPLWVNTLFSRTVNFLTKCGIGGQFCHAQFSWAPKSRAGQRWQTLKGYLLGLNCNVVYHVGINRENRASGYPARASLPIISMFRLNLNRHYFAKINTLSSPLDITYSSSGTYTCGRMLCKQRKQITFREILAFVACAKSFRNLRKVSPRTCAYFFWLNRKHISRQTKLFWCAFQP